MPHCCRWCCPSSFFCPFSRVLPPVSGSRVDPALKCDPTRPAPVGAGLGCPHGGAGISDATALCWAAPWWEKGSG